jgi:hypothetical protein
VSDEVIEAEAWLRQYFDQGDEYSLRAALIMTELARLRLVEQAATALVEHSTGEITSGDFYDFRRRRADLLDALAAAVRTEGT